MMQFLTEEDQNGTQDSKSGNTADMYSGTVYIYTLLNDFPLSFLTFPDCCSCSQKGESQHPNKVTLLCRQS